LSEGKYK
jgi:hypothetical protein